MASEENKLKNDILEVLSRLQVKAWRTQSGSTRVKGGYIHLAPEGTADIIGYMPYTGRILAIETKKKGKLPTPSQMQFLADIHVSHGFSLWIDDIGKFKVWIDDALKQDKNLAGRIYSEKIRGKVSN